jgi:phospholipid transport system transporter-binding protein
MSTDVGLKPAPGGYRLEGQLTFDTVAALYGNGPEIPAAGDLAIDLGSVSRVDSAGLALLIHWAGRCEGRGSRLLLTGVTGQLRSMMAITDVDGLIDTA